MKYIKRVLWRVAKRLSYIEDAWCLKVKLHTSINTAMCTYKVQLQAFYTATITQTSDLLQAPDVLCMSTSGAALDVGIEDKTVYLQCESN